MRILHSCVVYKFQTVNPVWSPSPPHTFWSRAALRGGQRGQLPRAPRC